MSFVFSRSDCHLTIIEIKLTMYCYKWSWMTVGELSCRGRPWITPLIADHLFCSCLRQEVTRMRLVISSMIKIKQRWRWRSYSSLPTGLWWGHRLPGLTLTPSRKSQTTSLRVNYFSTIALQAIHYL